MKRSLKVLGLFVLLSSTSALAFSLEDFSPRRAYGCEGICQGKCAGAGTAQQYNACMDWCTSACH